MTIPLVDCNSLILTETHPKLPKAIECIIDENIFGQFLECFDTKLNNSCSSSNQDPLKLVLTYMNFCLILTETFQQFLDMCSMDLNTIKNFQCYKRIGLILQKTESLFGQIEANEFQHSMEIDLLKELQAIFDSKFTDVIALLIRDYNIPCCMKWVRSCFILPTPFRFKCYKTKALDLCNLEPEQKKHHQALIVICRYVVYKAKNTNLIEDIFNVKGAGGSFYDVNIKNVTDVALFLDIVQDLVKSKRNSQIISKFVIINLNDVAADHYLSPQIVRKFCSILPYVCKFVKAQQTPNFIKDVALLTHSFPNQGLQRYSTELICDLLRNVKYYNKYFPLAYDQRVISNRDRTVYSLIIDFINNKSYQLQLQAATEAVLVFHKDWIDDKDTTLASTKQVESLESFYRSFLKQFDISKLVKADVNTVLLLYLSILEVNNSVKDDLIKLIMDVYYHTDCRTEVIQQVLPSLSNVGEQFRQNILEAIYYWVSKDYDLLKFPWCLTGVVNSCENFINFIYPKEMAIAMLAHSFGMLERLADCLSAPTKDLLRLIAPKAVGYYALKLMKDPNRQDEIKAALTHVLQVPDIAAHIYANISTTLQILIENMVDDGKF